MRVHVDTVDGGRTYRVRSMRQLAQLLLPALEAAEADMRAGCPDPYVSGVVFKRERPPGQGVEWWKRPARTLSCGGGDCDDLAPWRAASLRVSGEDPDALPVLVPIRPGLVHVAVQRGDGTLEDPSRVLGMGGARVQPKYQIRRVPRRGYQAMLRIPTSTAVVRGYGRGPSGAEALSRASDAVVSGLWEIGCIEDEALLVEGTQDTVDAAVYAAAGALAAIAPWGTLAGAILAGVYKLLGPYFFVKPYEPADDYPKAIAAAKGITLPDEGKNRAANIGACIANGWLPIYCSDSEGTRNNIAREFEIRGWFGGEKWSNRHGAEITTSYTWWYGVHFPLANYPEAYKAKAIAKANADSSTDIAIKRTMAFITNAKSRMRTYGGDEDYERMLLESWPLVPTDAAREDRQVTVTPRAEAGVAPAAGAPPASRGPTRPASAPRMTPAAFNALRADPAALGSSTPTVLTPGAADVVNATRQLTDLGRAGDWYALARLAGAVQREGRDGVMQRMARALINTRR